MSTRFVLAIKCAGRPAYQIALEAELHPSTLSRLLHGAERLRPNDPRVLAVARVLGLSPSECFEEQPAAPWRTLTPSGDAGGPP